MTRPTNEPAAAAGAEQVKARATTSRQTDEELEVQDQEIRATLESSVREGPADE